MIWERIDEETKGQDATTPLRQYIEERERTEGEDPKTWDKHGCGSRFWPWKKGPSMVLAYKDRHGQWKAMMAEIFPPELDDLIKKAGSEIHDCINKTDFTKVYKEIPMTFPITYKHPSYPFLSKFPIDEWVANGAEYMTVKGWSMFFMAITEGCKSGVLAEIFEVASALNQHEKSKEAEEKAEEGYVKRVRNLSQGMFAQPLPSKVNVVHEDEEYEYDIPGIGNTYKPQHSDYVEGQPVYFKRRKTGREFLNEYEVTEVKREGSHSSTATFDERCRPAYTAPDETSIPPPSPGLLTLGPHGPEGLLINSLENIAPSVDPSIPLDERLNYDDIPHSRF